MHLATKDGFKNDREEEITKATLIVENGKILRA